MSWLNRYRLKLYLRNSIWVFPIVGIVAGLVSVALLNRIDVALGWQTNVSLETGRIVMVTIAGSMFTLVVISSSAVLLAVQLASGQLTPRIIAFVYRNNARKISLAIFVFTFTVSIAVLVRLEGTVPPLTSYFAAYGFLINLAIFILFIDGVGKTIRPSTVLRSIALAGRKVVQEVYPLTLEEKHSVAPAPITKLDGEPQRFIPNEIDGVILAFDAKGLVSLAARSNCIIELIPEVGDFVAEGDPLFRIFDGDEDLQDDLLRRCLVVGQERTLEQDPMFAFRIIVDIASKALSPAINDPTTAVLAIDQIHHLLRDVGARYLAEGRESDTSGHLRLMYRTPNWEDFVHLAITEIRQYGRDSIQIMRRLRAMLENLIETLPERRAPLLRQELALLTSSSHRVFPDADDQDLAEAGDLQGLGSGHDRGRKKHVPAVA